MKKWNRLLAALITPVLLALPTATPAYAAAQPVTVTLPVEKQVQGGLPSKEETFTFQLTATQAGVPMPAADTIEIAGQGSGAFAPIEYDAPGNYQYTVHELPGENSLYTYDDTVYTVTVQISALDNDTLTAGVFIQKEGTTGKTDRIVFVNTIDPDSASSSSSSSDSSDSSEPSSDPGASDPTSVVPAPGTSVPPASGTGTPHLPQTNDISDNGAWLMLLVAFAAGAVLFGVLFLCQLRSRKHN